MHIVQALLLAAASLAGVLQWYQYRMYDLSCCTHLVKVATKGQETDAQLCAPCSEREHLIRHVPFGMSKYTARSAACARWAVLV